MAKALVLINNIILVVNIFRSEANMHPGSSIIVHNCFSVNDKTSERVGREGYTGLTSTRPIRRVSRPTWLKDYI